MIRDLKGFYLWLCIIFVWIALGVNIYQIFPFTFNGFSLLSTQWLSFMLLLFLPLVFLLYPANTKPPEKSSWYDQHLLDGINIRDKIPWYDIVLACLSIAGPTFVIFYALPLQHSLWVIRPPIIVMVLGIITVLLVLEASRRTVSWIFTLILVIFTLYPMISGFLPGMLHGRNIPIERLIVFHLASTQSLLGLPMQVYAKLIIGFMVFGAGLKVTGASAFLIDLSLAIAGKAKGGAAMVGVVGSALMASISGSSMANIASIGSIAIPAMRKVGYSAEMAGAIIAVASNAGMLMPPVMGAIAFLMAGLLNIPYYVICLAALIPSVIFYTSLLSAVFAHAYKKNMPSLPSSEIPSFTKTLAGGWFYLGAIVVLVYMLFWVRIEAWAPYYATIFLFLCSFVKKETRPNKKTIYNFSMELIRILPFLAVIMSAFGLLMGSLELSGIIYTLASDLTAIAGGSLFLLLILGGAGAFILGMTGMMFVIYIFMAFMFAPAFIEVGVAPIVSHMFFLYWGILACITPPVATTVFTVCAISQSPPMRTAWVASKLAIAIYIIPFAFVVNPALLLQGPWQYVVWAALAAILGGAFIAFAMEGYMPVLGNISALLRILMFCSGFILFFMPLEGTIGAAIIAVLFILTIRTKRNQKEIIPLQETN